MPNLSLCSIQWKMPTNTPNSSGDLRADPVDSKAILLERGEKQELFLWFTWWGSSQPQEYAPFIRQELKWQCSNRIPLLHQKRVVRRKLRRKKDAQRNPFQNHQFQLGGKTGQPFYRQSPFLAAIVKQIITVQTTKLWLHLFVKICVIFLCGFFLASSVSSPSTPPQLFEFPQESIKVTVTVPMRL